MGFIDFITNWSNLSHVFPLVLVAIFGVGIVLERYKSLFGSGGFSLAGKDKFLARVRELVVAGNVQEAIALCNQYPEKPVPSIVKEGLLRAHLPEEMIGDGLNLVVGDWAEKISKRTTFLSMIANVATLLGLFGTIAGLIQSFKAVESADPQQKSAILASGISTAMNATMMGLGIAIPAMIAFSILMNRTNRLMGEMDQSVLVTLDIIRQRSYGVETVKRVA